MGKLTKPGGPGLVGTKRFEWPHVPLWTVYQEWGWGTEDGVKVLAYLKRFGSVAVLNGHIHQTMQKVEGNVTFHTAASTAFPQPKAGAAPGEYEDDCSLHPKMTARLTVLE